MIYIDTNIFIYLFENHQEYATKVASFLDKNIKTTQFITSVITITELSAGNPNITTKTIQQLQGLKIIPIDENIASLAGSILHQDKMPIGDALHYATAQSTNCDAIYTNDTILAKKAYKKMQVIMP
jgi:predicted nucleic acid-binding protein